MNLLFEFKALVLNFQKEVTATENVLVLTGCGASSFILACHQVFAQLAGQTTRKPDQPSCVFGKIFLADARLFVEAVKRCL